VPPNLLSTLSFLSLFLVSHTLAVKAESVDVSAELGLESRYFFEQGLQNQERFQPSIRGELEYQNAIDANYFNFVLFGRFDSEDMERSHIDIREAYWTHVADNWEMKVGVSKVFWGVTESRHLVDVINQTDLVENVDGEDKLGQPMLKFAIEREWGNLDFFWLPYFRERTFPGKQGRLNALPFIVDVENTQYQSSAEQWHNDFALRYAVYIDDLDIAISHFSGTSRNPVFVDKNGFPTRAPIYNQIDQTGLELQYIFEEWLWKFEGITSSGEVQRYSAAVFGFEYTQVGILETSADLGWIVEYLFDDRRQQKNLEKSALHSFERDFFLGWRYAMNDIDSIQFLAGIIYDPKTEEMLYSLEFNQRLASDLKLNIEVRSFQGAEASKQLKTFYLRDEDYIQLELVKFF
tara:strand:+ start:14503 stop:15720 length:1218 start_codon:yes stop_codon:yes gene_type:complete